MDPKTRHQEEEEDEDDVKIITSSGATPMPLEDSENEGGEVAEGTTVPQRRTSGLTLNMIVKDEAKVIARCFDSVQKHLARMVIHDTGSTDNTPEVIREYCVAHGIDCVVNTDHVFRNNFGHSRTLALKEAWDRTPEGEWILMIDADMVVSDCFRPPLSGPAGGPHAMLLMRQTSGGNFHYNVRLTRKEGRLPVPVVIGATHEYVSYTGRSKANYEQGYLFHYGDGGSRSDKFERDLRILSSQPEPKGPRTRFYLAQTLKDLGRHAEAIEEYKRYIPISTFEEEKWYAIYMISRCHANLGQYIQAQAAAFLAFETRPTRIEPLYHLAKVCLDKLRWTQTALMILQRCVQLSVPKDDILFVEGDLYNHHAPYLFGTLTPDKAEALRIFDTLRLTKDYRRCLSLKDVECHLLDKTPTLNAALGNSEDSPLASHVVHTPLAMQEILSYPELHSANPSFIANPDDVDEPLACVNIRLVNYTIGENGGYTYPGGVVRTQNMGLVTPTGYVMGTGWLGDDLEAGRDNVKGYEDVRLVRRRSGQVWFSCTVATQPCTTIRLVTLDPAKRNGALSAFWDLSDGQTRTEKNWLPFVPPYEVEGDDDPLWFVYGYQPTIQIWRWDDRTKQVQPYREGKTNTPANLSHFRGSGGPIFTPDGKTMFLLVHEAWGCRGPRVYTHRFLQLDARTFDLQRMSRPFRFLAQTNIEFASTMVRHRERVYIGWGLQDRQAFQSVLSLADLKAFCCEELPQ